MPEGLDTERFFAGQDWRRDHTEPCIALGADGNFDAQHLFAPCVAYEDGLYRMWYSGSGGSVAQRVFTLGAATSRDGLHFEKHGANPVLRFKSDYSILTPTLLRAADGSLLRENGRLRLWFSSCDFPAQNPLHTLHETHSEDGIRWETPSVAQLENIYAPTIIKEDGRYLMWYVDVTEDPWYFRFAESRDGCNWQVHPQPVLELSQPWEHQRLFYPTVLKEGDTYWMWYGSYSSHGAGKEMKTALGFAVSQDGVHWEKHPRNPVFGPDLGSGETHAWESHYTTSQSVLRMPDGRWRIWYAARPKPPFDHKYFAIGTATWEGI